MVADIWRGIEAPVNGVSVLLERRHGVNSSGEGKGVRRVAASSLLEIIWEVQQARGARRRSKRYIVKKGLVKRAIDLLLLHLWL